MYMVSVLREAVWLARVRRNETSLVIFSHRHVGSVHFFIWILSTSHCPKKYQKPVLYPAYIPDDGSTLWMQGFASFVIICLVCHSLLLTSVCESSELPVTKIPLCTAYKSDQWKIELCLGPVKHRLKSGILRPKQNISVVDPDPRVFGPP